MLKNGVFSHENDSEAKKSLSLPIEKEKSRYMKNIVKLSVLVILLLCSCRSNASKGTITAEMAYQGVNNYCHSQYDWSVAEENPSMMYVTMGDSTESEYKVIFRSYTGAFVNFYVDKASGKTRMVESVPALDVDSVVGTINLFDYLEKDQK